MCSYSWIPIFRVFQKKIMIFLDIFSVWVKNITCLITWKLLIEFCYGCRYLLCPIIIKLNFKEFLMIPAFFPQIFIDLSRFFRLLIDNHHSDNLLWSWTFLIEFFHECSHLLGSIIPLPTSSKYRRITAQEQKFYLICFLEYDEIRNSRLLSHQRLMIHVCFFTWAQKKKKIQ